MSTRGPLPDVPISERGLRQLEIWLGRNIKQLINRALVVGDFLHWGINTDTDRGLFLYGHGPFQSNTDGFPWEVDTTHYDSDNQPAGAGEVDITGSDFNVFAAGIFQLLADSPDGTSVLKATGDDEPTLRLEAGAAGSDGRLELHADGNAILDSADNDVDIQALTGGISIASTLTKVFLHNTGNKFQIIDSDETTVLFEITAT